MPAAHSGFLRDYSQLKPHATIEGAMLYQHPSKGLKDYKTFIVDPIVVHFAPNASGMGIDPEDLKELADYWRNGNVKQVMDPWVERLVTRLDEAHGFAKK